MASRDRRIMASPSQARRSVSMATRRPGGASGHLAGDPGRRVRAGLRDMGAAPLRAALQLTPSRRIVLGSVETMIASDAQ